MPDTYEEGKACQINHRNYLPPLNAPVRLMENPFPAILPENGNVNGSGNISNVDESNARSNEDNEPNEVAQLFPSSVAHDAPHRDMMYVIREVHAPPIETSTQTIDISQEDAWKWKRRFQPASRIGKCGG